MNEIFFDPNFLMGELSLVALIVVLTIVDAFQRPIFALFGEQDSPGLDYRNRQASWLAGIGLIVVAIVYLFYGRATSGEEVTLFNHSLKAGGGIYIGKLALISAGILAVLLSWRYTQAQSIPGMDYYLLLCFSLLGAVTLIAAENFLMIFLALEMMSIPIYALVGLKRFGSRAGESAIKYLLLGGFSSGFLLLGISFLYGATGSLVVDEIVSKLTFTTFDAMGLALAPMLHKIQTVQAVLFYGIGYIFMNMLAFGVLVYLTHKEKYCETLDDLKGIARKYPGAAAMMAVAMFSLGGLPPAVGFVGKVQIFMQLLEGKMYVTAVIALIFSLVALYFYINVIVVMYMKEPDEETKEIGKSGIVPVWISLALSTLFVLILGLLPSHLLKWSLKWAETLF